MLIEFVSQSLLSLIDQNCLFFPRRQDASIGFGAPVRANMRAGAITNAMVTSSLLESVRTKTQDA
jgi:ATP-dependent Clp protease ATP-binding subunit ClpX